MGFLQKHEALERLRKEATNSSHFVWLLADLRYYQCENSWLFGFTQIRDVTLIALEPVIPGAPTQYVHEHKAAFDAAWAEFSKAVNPKISAFVSVYDPFLEILRPAGFNSVKVGQEPWIDLKDCIPTGNAAKGVRSARNQALAAGLNVEEWTASDFEKDEKKRQIMAQIYRDWKTRTLVGLSGFMNATDPFAYAADRRYFVLESQDRVEAFLIATPVAGIQGYFLEDLVIRSNAPRGSGELLTLEAMVTLGDSGGMQASLGVVSMTTLDAAGAQNLPKAIKFLLVTVPYYMQLIYNFNGMEVYRKRFKPHSWKNINVAVKNDSSVSDTWAWIKVIFALLVAFKPKIQFTSHWLKKIILGPVRRYPITILTTSLAFFLFASVNHFGELPQWALARFGFYGQAPWHEWLYRSVISDFLYFDLTHFLSAGIMTAVVVFWAERVHKRKVLFTFLACSLLLSDFINYWLVIKPFEYFHPEIFKNLIAYKDVGGSLILISLLGFQVCQFHRSREQVYSAIILLCILFFAFTSARYEGLILNLNHAVFFILGFVAGKTYFEYTRHLSRLASKGKPPVARSVSHLPHQKQSAANSERKKAA